MVNQESDPAFCGPFTILDLLAENARRYQQAPALLAPGRAPLSHVRLLHQVERTIGAIKSAGFGPDDRIALVLENGPEMAVGFLAISGFSVCIPVNPTYKPPEFDAAFAALHPSAVLTSARGLSLLSGIASKHGAAVFEVVPDRECEAGVFALTRRSKGRFPTPSMQNRAALLLQTSGTTSRPKLVALTQDNLLRSAENIMRSLELGAADRCLNVMPLFHIHGLVGALLASLRAGSSMVCCPGFQASRFFDGLREFRPTWYTAVPTMHASIAMRAARHDTKPQPHALRFIRSCSAALPTRLLHQLEELFGVPVVEAYGMTEASHQIASNRLPPAQRKTGSVGLAAGTQVAILDEVGRPLPPGTPGEIAVRGPSVINGYLENPSANRQSFIDGWLRTGDIGSVDGDGYLFIKGRAKEIINRGGAKISPYEIEEVLLDHPAVVEAVAFALPDERLGEDIGAAVVLHMPDCVTAAELRNFISGRLADFKIPHHFAFVGEIPRGPTGKPQRIGLATTLGIGQPTSNTGPELVVRDGQLSGLEELLLGLWARALDTKRVALDDNFFALGGDSAAATELLLEIEQVTGTELSISALFEAPSVRELVRLIDRTDACPLSQRVLPINARGSQPPFFCLGAGPLFWPLAQRLGADQPFFSVLDPSQDSPTLRCIEDIAAFHTKSIRAVQPEGPYVLGGWCIHGVIAYEIARQLRAQGQEVRLLVLFDATNPGRWEKYPTLLVPLLQAFDAIQTCWFHVKALRALRRGECLTYVRDRLLTLLRRLRLEISFLRSGLDHRFGDRLRREKTETFMRIAALRYRPKPYSGPIVLFRRTLRPLGPGQDRALGWTDVVVGQFTVVNVLGDHRDMFLEPQVGYVADKIALCMRSPKQVSADQKPVAPVSSSQASAASPMPIWRLSKLGMLAAQILHWLVPW